MHPNEARFTYKDCTILEDQGQVVLSNHCIRLHIDLSRGIPRLTSIYNCKIDENWLRPETTVPMFRVNGLAQFAADEVYISAKLDDDAGIAVEHVCMKVDMICRALSVVVCSIWKIYPNAAFVQHEVAVKRLTAAYAPPTDANSWRINLMKVENESMPSPGERDYICYLPLVEQHTRFEMVRFNDVTDHHNNLVESQGGLLFPHGSSVYDGNIAFIEKTNASSGLVILKEGPTPLARLGEDRADYLVNGFSLYVLGSGFDEEQAWDDELLPAYGCMIGVFEKGEYAKYALLDQYARCIRKNQPQRDYFIMCNNWGDRAQDGRISEPFLLAELEAAAALGVTHYQIDDGWQHGATKNSVNAREADGGKWSGYHSADFDFWAPHPERLPNGFAPIIAQAERLGIQLCLWFSPDSDDDFVNWEKDADIMLDLHKRYNISHFKLDGIRLRSKKGERHLINMMRKAIIKSAQRMYFNLDTTDEVRLGYYGRTQYGGLFLENRYTDWKNYYPHWTLRNLWSLSRYIPARKLQIEFLNVQRNREKYGEDPLSPYACGLMYSFAVSLFANPLAWMELTGLAADDAQRLTYMLQLVKPHHAAILSGHILPIGQEPSGVGWTGFQSVTNEREGYVLVFREWNEQSTYPLQLWGLGQEPLLLEEIVGATGTEVRVPAEAMKRVDADGEGRYRFELSMPLSFSLFVYRIDSHKA